MGRPLFKLLREVEEPCGVSNVMLVERVLVCAPDPEANSKNLRAVQPNTKRLLWRSPVVLRLLVCWEDHWLPSPGEALVSWFLRCGLFLSGLSRLFEVREAPTLFCFQVGSSLRIFLLLDHLGRGQGSARRGGP